MRVPRAFAWICMARKRNEIRGYRADGFFGRPAPGDRFPSAWILYGGNVEAEWKMRPGLGLLYSMVPGFPFVITSSLGLRKAF
jgi:hypothetical protein